MSRHPNEGIHPVIIIILLAREYINKPDYIQIRTGHTVGAFCEIIVTLTGRSIDFLRRLNTIIDRNGPNARHTYPDVAG